MNFTIYRSREDDLIQGCVRRDHHAQQQLYDRFSKKMFGLCHRYVKDSMEAEDILVCAFTKVFEKIGQFRGEGSLEGWIRRITVNEALTYLRRNRSLQLETTLESAGLEPDFDGFGDHLVEEDLLAMIQRLPPGYRLVFNMYAIDGYSHKEIAEQLGISENTSKSQLSRARIHLQKMLADSEQNLKRPIHDGSTTG